MKERGRERKERTRNGLREAKDWEKERWEID